MEARESEFDAKCKRIQKCADEITAIVRSGKYEVPEFIEALGAVLATYLMENGGKPAMAHFLTHMIVRAEEIYKVEFKLDDYPSL